MARKQSTSTGFSSTDAAYWLTVLAVLAVSFLPEERLWGINWFAYIPWYWRLAALTAAFGGWYFAKRLPADRRDTPPDRSSPFLQATAVLAAVLCALFWLLSVETHFLGDGYFMITRVYEEAGPLRTWHLVPYALQEFVYSLASERSEAASRAAFQLISYGSGLIFLIVAALASVRLFASTNRRWLFVLGAITGGYLLMFFGYVENYPPYLAAVGIFSLVGLLSGAGHLGSWWIIPAWMLAAAFHIYAVALLPAAVYLLLSGTALGARIAALSRTARIGGLVAMMAAGIAVIAVAYNSYYFFRFALVPFVPDAFTVEGYHLFSAKHLLDYANQLVLLLPAIGMLAVLLFDRKFRKLLCLRESRFLGIALIGSLLLIFLFYPRLGMPRDWDLFAFAGVPLVLLFYYTVLTVESGLPKGRSVAVLGLVLGLLVFAPRLATQLDVERSIAVFDNYAALDRIRNDTGRFVLLQYLRKNGRVAEAKSREDRYYRLELPQEDWVREGKRASDRGDNELAISLFRRARGADPQNAYAWLNYGVQLYLRGRLDSALICVEIADGLKPDNFDNIANLGTICYELGQKDRAERLWLRACELEPDKFLSRAFLLRLYLMNGREREFTEFMTECANRVDGSADYDRGLGDFFLEYQDFTSAARAYRRALSKGLDVEYVRQLQQQHERLRVVE